MGSVRHNGWCPLCGASAYVGLHTRVECSRSTCENSPELRNMPAEAKELLRNLKARLDELDEREGPHVEQAKADVEKAIQDLLDAWS